MGVFLSVLGQARAMGEGMVRLDDSLGFVKDVFMLLRLYRLVRDFFQGRWASVVKQFNVGSLSPLAAYLVSMRINNPRQRYRRLAERTLFEKAPFVLDAPPFDNS
jgi:hypothetical protein